MERNRKDFYWGVIPTNNKIFWIAWNTMLASKKNGGAGIGSISAASKALLCKWLWRFNKKRYQLWTKCILAIHYKRSYEGSFPLKKLFQGLGKISTRTRMR